MLYPDSEKCPQHIVESLERYVKHRYRPGGFLTAVLSNNLLGAIQTADANSLENLPHIVAYVYNRLPSAVWGTLSVVNSHIYGNEE